MLPRHSRRLQMLFLQKHFLCKSKKCQTKKKLLSSGGANSHFTLYHRGDDKEQVYCTTCRITIKWTTLNQHFNADHGDVFKYHCHLCEYETYYKQPFNRHLMQTHRALKQIKCSECNYKNQSISELNRHIRQIHKEINCCDECQKNYLSRWGWKKHMTTVHKVKIPRKKREKKLKHSEYTAEKDDSTVGTKANKKKKIAVVTEDQEKTKKLILDRNRRKSGRMKKNLKSNAANASKNHSRIHTNADKVDIEYSVTPLKDINGSVADRVKKIKRRTNIEQNYTSNANCKTRSTLGENINVFPIDEIENLGISDAEHNTDEIDKALSEFDKFIADVKAKRYKTVTGEKTDPIDDIDDDCRKNPTGDLTAPTAEEEDDSNAFTDRKDNICSRIKQELDVLIANPDLSFSTLIGNMRTWKSEPN